MCDKPMGGVIHRFERVIILILLSLMMLTVACSLIELVVLLVDRILTPPILILEAAELRDIFGYFLMILVGLELLETMKAYLRDDIVHVEVVFLAAMVAVARKVILLDPEKIASTDLLAVAALLLGLSGAYYLVKYANLLRADSRRAAKMEPESPPHADSGESPTR